METGTNKLLFFVGGVGGGGSRKDEQHEYTGDFETLDRDRKVVKRIVCVGPLSISLSAVRHRSPAHNRGQGKQQQICRPLSTREKKAKLIIAGVFRHAVTELLLFAYFINKKCTVYLRGFYRLRLPPKGELRINPSAAMHFTP